MSEPFIAEIRIFAGNFAPRGWAFCDGQLLPIANNTALFSLIGTTYGGDGRTTTALPNLQGRAPMHPGAGPGLTRRRLGETAGIERVELTESQLPNHSHYFHTVPVNGNEYTPDPTVALAEGLPGGKFADPYHIYSDSTNQMVPMSSEAIRDTGGGQTHNNVQPYLVMNYIIALQGLYPSRG